MVSASTPASVQVRGEQVGQIEAVAELVFAYATLEHLPQTYSAFGFLSFPLL